MILVVREQILLGCYQTFGVRDGHCCFEDKKETGVILVTVLGENEFKIRDMAWKELKRYEGNKKRGDSLVIADVEIEVYHVFHTMKQSELRGNLMSSPVIYLSPQRNRIKMAKRRLMTAIDLFGQIYKVFPRQ